MEWAQGTAQPGVLLIPQDSQPIAASDFAASDSRCPARHTCQSTRRCGQFLRLNAGLTCPLESVESAQHTVRWWSLGFARCCCCCRRCRRCRHRDRAGSCAGLPAAPVHSAMPCGSPDHPPAPPHPVAAGRVQLRAVGACNTRLTRGAGEGCSQGLENSCHTTCKCCKARRPPRRRRPLQASASQRKPWGSASLPQMRRRMCWCHRTAPKTWPPRTLAAGHSCGGGGSQLRCLLGQPGRRDPVPCTTTCRRNDYELVIRASKDLEYILEAHLGD